MTNLKVNLKISPRLTTVDSSRRGILTHETHINFVLIQVKKDRIEWSNNVFSKTPSSQPAAKIEHFGIEICKTLTLEILFSHFEKGGGGYNFESCRIFSLNRSPNIGDQPPGRPLDSDHPPISKVSPSRCADTYLPYTTPPHPHVLSKCTAAQVCVFLCTNIP